MVCKDCEKKLTGVIVPDKWKCASAASSSSTGSSSSSAAAAAGGTSKALGLARNSLIGAKKAHTREMLAQGSCKLCKKAVHQRGAYCQACAYKKGICAMCGKKVLDTKFYKQSAV